MNNMEDDEDFTAEEKIALMDEHRRKEFKKATDKADNAVDQLSSALKHLIWRVKTFGDPYQELKSLDIADVDYVATKVVGPVNDPSKKQ